MNLYQIHNIYNDGKLPCCSGHKILAKSRNNALNIAITHKIANPFGRKVKKRRVYLFKYTIKEYINRFRSSIWLENTKGRLLEIRSKNRIKSKIRMV